MFSFIVIIIALLAFRYGMRVAYLVSAGATLYILVEFQALSHPLEILLLGLVFNLTPLVPEVFRRHFTEVKDNLYQQLENTRSKYSTLLRKEDSLRENNRILEKEMQEIANLYEITREMSSALNYEEIFDVLSSFILKTFGDYKDCRLVLVNSEIAPGGVEQIFQANDKEAKTNDADQRLYDIMSQMRKVLVLTNSDRDTLFWQKLFLDDATESFLAVPLLVDNQLVAILSVRNLLAKSFEKFLIIASQFNLEIKKVRIYKKVEEMAITDGLTNLYSRRYFVDRLAEEIKRSQEHKLKFTFIMIDIDHFKSYNDRFGHLVGDMVLKKISEIIESSIREVDLAARYGGEEFAVILPDTDYKGAEHVAERIRHSTESYNFRVYDEEIYLTISLGCAIFPADGRRSSTVINHADQALYSAKGAGRNKVVFYNEIKDS